MSATDTANDEDLMARIAGGDRAAFSALAARHLDRTVALATRILGRAGDAEDVAQDVFVRVWTTAERWQAGRARFTTWLYRITVNRCLDLKRRPPMRELESVAEPIDPAADALGALEQAEADAAMAAALAGLPERQRAALALCYTDGVSQQEAASAMDLSIDALESLLARAKRSLRQALAAGRGLGR